MVLTQKYMYKYQYCFHWNWGSIKSYIHKEKIIDCALFKKNSKKNMGRGHDEGMNKKTLPSPSSGISDYSEINDT